jgi:hypothetical protein
MKHTILNIRTNSYLKNNKTLRLSVPYQQAKSIGVIFSVEDKLKHDEVKDFVRKLEHDGKNVKVICFRPEGKDNYQFMFDYFTDEEFTFWGNITSESVNRFVGSSFDFLFYLDVTPNPLILNVIARSKAKCRVGQFWEKGKPFFELMIEVKNGIKSLADGMYKYASSLQ